MPRDVRAYLADIIEACDAIVSAVDGIELEDFQSNRLVRSSVEREFIIVGEAIAAIRRGSPAIFDRITRARRIVDFRNQLTHQYPTIDTAIVWAIIGHDVGVLRSEASELLAAFETGPPDR